MARARVRAWSSIEWKLVAAVSAVLLVVAGALSWAAYLQVRRSTETAATERLSALASQLVSQGTSQVQSAKLDVRRLARSPAVAAWFRAADGAARSAAWPATAEALSRDSTLVTVELWDPTGGLLRTLHPDILRISSPAILTELRRDANGADSAAVGRFVAQGDTIFFPAAAAVRADGRVLGYVVEWHPVQRNPRAREQIARLLGSGAILYVGSTPGAWSDQQEMVGPPPSIPPRLGTTIRYTRAGGDERIAAGSAVAGAPWIMVLEFSEKIVREPTRTFLRQIGLIALVVVALGLVVTWTLGRHITVPLRGMTAIADARATGEYSARVPVTGHDELGRLAGAFNDMADHLDNEIAGRRKSEAQWRLLFRTNPHPMWVFDAETYRFLAVNDAAIEKYGYTADEFLAMTIHDIRPVDEAQRLQRSLAEPEETKPGEIWRHRLKDGRIIDVQIDANTLVFDDRPARLVLAQDITDRRALESQLRQAQRMEAVGRLAGGVAHDFNNVLTVVMACAQLVQDALAPEHAAAGDIRSILESAERAHGLTRQLLAVSRQQVLQPVVIDPNDAVGRVRGLLDRVIGEDIKMETELAADIGMVLVDPGQLEQVLLNLAVNARDAMPAGGRLTISTQSVDLDEIGSALHGLSQTGRFVVIAVADTGVGMSPEVRARIFDPFFTTKAVGKGTGLGLASVYGIVTQSGGGVTVYSEEGIGSTFRVYFPRADAPVASAPVASERASVQGNETILLVEDELAVRGAVTQVLTRLGYSVISAGSGEEALAVAAGHQGPLDLVVSDVVMPGMDGPALLLRLREQRPGLRALLLSGYSGEAVASRGFAEANAHFLQKPFSLAALSHKVREALGGETTPLA